MNFTFCERDQKTIRNWQRQCGSCIHGRFVIFRGTTKDGTPSSYGGAFLYQCPHVAMRHKRIGKDTHKSKPRTNTELVHTALGIRIIGISRYNSVLETLDWQVVQYKLFNWRTVEMAELPRSRWLELLGFESPEPKPCLGCRQ